MIRRPPRSTRTDTLFPYTTLFRSHDVLEHLLQFRLAQGTAGGVLAHFEAGHGHTAGIRRLARGVHDPRVLEDMHGIEVTRHVCPFGNRDAAVGDQNAGVLPLKSEEPPVGKEVVSTCRFRGWPDT